jgi:D-inositol-3-phosphate glycosyltransferase
LATSIAVISIHADPLGRLGSKETGGMNVYIRELAGELAREGLVLDIFTRKVDGAEPEVVELTPGARVIRIAAGPQASIDKNDVYYYLPEFVAGVERFRRQNALAYDVVHSHYWLSAWAGARLAYSWQVPHATMFHTLGEVKNRCGAPGEESALRIAVERQSVAVADRIVAASADEQSHLVNLYQANPRLVEIIPCGVNTKLFRPLDRPAARDQLGLSGSFTLLFVGRMDPLKGADILLAAAAQLAPRIPELRVVVVGGDAAPESEETRVRELACRLGLEGIVRFEGAVPQGQLPFYYSAADLCVVPSYYESFGLVAVEALACGTPVVASRVGGLPVVVKSGENGLLVAERSPEAFAASIGTLYEDRERLAALAATARRSVGHLNWNAIARRICAVYDTLASADQPRPGSGRCLPLVLPCIGRGLSA